MKNFIQKENTITYTLKDDGVYPNNNELSLIIYKGVFNAGNEEDISDKIIPVLKKNGWVNAWKNGIYGMHHYHSTAHEILGICQGEANVQLGGPEGIKIKVEKGDAIVIPSGVAHRNLGASEDFACVGAYPAGQSYDMNYGKEDERPGVIENIKNTPLPEKDPIYGKEGPVVNLWRK